MSRWPAGHALLVHVTLRLQRHTSHWLFSSAAALASSKDPWNMMPRGGSNRPASPAPAALPPASRLPPSALCTHPCYLIC